MGTAVRLAMVCALVLGGVFALRARSNSPVAPASATDAGADDIVLVNLAGKNDKLSMTDENKKVVPVEAIRIAALQANAKMESEPERETRHRRHAAHRHWHYRRSNKSRRH
jgi:hypothetical protein